MRSWSIPALVAVIEVEKPLNPEQHGGLWAHQLVQHHLNPKPGARSWRFQFHRAREPRIQLRRILRLKAPKRAILRRHRPVATPQDRF